MERVLKKNPIAIFLIIWRSHDVNSVYMPQIMFAVVMTVVNAMEKSTKTNETR